MTVILEHKSGYRLGAEEKLVIEALAAAGTTFQIAALSQIYRGRVDTRHADLVVGGMGFIKAALRQRDITMPVIDSYPAVLESYLHRRVWQARLRDALSVAKAGTRVFVKPSKRPKLFSGYVLDYFNDHRAAGAPPSEPVWCSDVVSWASEWRAYVVDGSVAFLGFYEGDRACIPDWDTVSSAVRAMSLNPGAPVSYAIDFGLISTGETALIEVNDAFAIDAYDNVPGELYLKMLKTRWDQLVQMECSTFPSGP
ncbi:ATP-grasp domain-containing protein [Pseudomonas sp. NPDC089569]|uniref:ATP-grasp domain-containing protein n=1 Tax=Pseudomonas sp. NPDC089569 TaxID=3390722 RepID=UPI003D08CCF4